MRQQIWVSTDKGEALFWLRLKRKLFHAIGVNKLHAYKLFFQILQRYHYLRVAYLHTRQRLDAFGFHVWVQMNIIAVRGLVLFERG